MADKVPLEEVVEQYISADIQGAINNRLEGKLEGSLEYKREDPRIVEDRLRREDRRDKFDTITKFIANIVGLIVALIIIGVSSYILINHNYTLDEKKLAQPILAAAAGTIFGYLFAKSQSK